MRLKNKVAIVVGAGQTPGDTIGNGRATAILFDRDRESALETAALMSAIDRQHYPGDELGFVGGQEQGGERDIPGGAHLLTQRNAGVPPPDQFLFRNAARPRDALDGQSSRIG